MLFKELVVFGQEMLRSTTKAVKRGTNESTMYFLIPKQFRGLIKAGKSYDCDIITGSKDKYLVIKLK